MTGRIKKIKTIHHTSNALKEETKIKFCTLSLQKNKSENTKEMVKHITLA